MIVIAASKMPAATAISRATPSDASRVAIEWPTGGGADTARREDDGIGSAGVSFGVMGAAGDAVG